MSLITKSYGMPDPNQFNDQYKHKYFCEVVQGNVSNVVRQETSVAVKANTWIPTGSIAFVDEDGFAAAGLGISTDTKVAVPQVVFVGTEHGNVFSEKYNSGCGLITMIPLTANNDIMTTVYDAEGTYTVGTLLTAKAITFDGKSVYAVTPAAAGETVIGIVRTAPEMHHNGVRGLIFSAYFKPAADDDESSSSL